MSSVPDLWANAGVENPGAAVRDNVSAAVEGARNAAVNVAGNINNFAENRGRIFKEVQVTAESVAVPVAAAVTRQVQSHWRMIAPLLCGIFTTVITIALQVYSPATVDTGNLASLIPLVMIMGEPILSKAISITTANPRQDSPHFGCGWLSWSLNAVMTAIAKTTELVAKPENVCKVVNLKYGHDLVNNSFVLSRILRDLESKSSNKVSGLSIAILDAGKQKALLSWADVFSVNFWSTATMLSQLVVCLLAVLTTGDMNPLMFFSACLFLIEGIANLPAWNAHKFSARKDKYCKSTYALMRGNGHRRVFVIRNVHEDAWDLEDMAGGGSSHYNYTATPEFLVIISTALAFAGLTIAASMMPFASAANILIVLAIGTVQNVCTAAMPRDSWMHGVALKSVETISDDRKVMAALTKLEEKYPGIADPLVKEFFPSGLREDEQKWWNNRKEACKQKKADAKAEKARKAAEMKEDIMETYDVDQDVSTKKLEKEMEKAIRGQ